MSKIHNVTDMTLCMLRNVTEHVPAACKTIYPMNLLSLGTTNIKKGEFITVISPLVKDFSPASKALYW